MISFVWRDPETVNQPNMEAMLSDCKPDPWTVEYRKVLQTITPDVMLMFKGVHDQKRGDGQQFSVVSSIVLGHDRRLSKSMLRTMFQKWESAFELWLNEEVLDAPPSLVLLDQERLRELAVAIAAAIKSDLHSRSGFDHELDGLDEEVEAEMLEDWIKEIEGCFLRRGLVEHA
jgi:hypothetical protein